MSSPPPPPFMGQPMGPPMGQPMGQPMGPPMGMQPYMAGAQVPYQQSMGRVGHPEYPNVKIHEFTGKQLAGGIFALIVLGTFLGFGIAVYLMDYIVAIFNALRGV